MCGQPIIGVSIARDSKNKHLLHHHMFVATNIFSCDSTCIFSTQIPPRSIFRESTKIVCHKNSVPRCIIGVLKDPRNSVPRGITRISQYADNFPQLHITVHPDQSSTWHNKRLITSRKNRHISGLASCKW